jgi:hypothetical protein
MAERLSARSFGVMTFAILAASPRASPTKRASRNRTAADLAPNIAELRAAGITKLNDIAAALDARRVPTPAGSGHWHAAQGFAGVEAVGRVIPSRALPWFESYANQDRITRMALRHNGERKT